MSDEDLFLQDQHPASGRCAILDDDGTSAWLYLRETNSVKPIADAWVYNRIVAPSATEIQSYRGRPPPAVQGYASEAALCPVPAMHEWSFLWSSDGESVAVLKNGEAVAFIVAGTRGGYSRELIQDGPWGHPWSEETFRATFSLV